MTRRVSARELVGAMQSIRRLASGIAICCYLAISATAQTDGEWGDVVSCAGRVQSSGNSVVAVELDGRGTRYRAEVDGSGNFRLNGVAAGDYSATAIDRSGNQMDAEFVSVRQGMAMLLLRVPEQRRESFTRATVSAARLAHKIPKEAWKEIERAERATEKNDSLAAIDHLKKAIAIDPDCMEAHNSLGARYMATVNFQFALEEFQKAFKLDPRNPVVNSNIAAALLNLGLPSEAEVAARRSVELDGTRSQARYLLGTALLNQGKLTPEMEKSLRQASDDMPAAHLVLGKVFIATGRMEDGERELRAYLDSGRPQERPAVLAWVQKHGTTDNAGCRRDAQGKHDDCLPLAAHSENPVGR